MSNLAKNSRWRNTGKKMVALAVASLFSLATQNAQAQLQKPVKIIFPQVDIAWGSGFPFRVINPPAGSTYQFFKKIPQYQGANYQALDITPTPVPMPVAVSDSQSGMSVVNLKPYLRGIDGTAGELELRVFDKTGAILATDSRPYARGNAFLGAHHDALNAFYVNRAGQNVVDFRSGTHYVGIARAAGSKFSGRELATWRTNRDYHNNEAANCYISYMTKYPCSPAIAGHDVWGGWFDAGDQGKYTVNGATALWHLFNLIERELPYLKDEGVTPTSAAGIAQRAKWWTGYKYPPANVTPGSQVTAPAATATDLPKIVEEARFQMEWLLRMQISIPYQQMSLPVGNQDVPHTSAQGYGVKEEPLQAVTYKDYVQQTGASFGTNLFDPGTNATVKLRRQELKFTESIPVAGMVYHSVHDENWTPVPTLPANNTEKRVLEYPTTAATLSLAATGAQCYRIFKKIDPAFADKCYYASESAMAAAKATATDAIYFYGEYANANGVSGPLPSMVKGGGAYADTRVDDLIYWARMERYLMHRVKNGDTAETRQMLRDMVTKKGYIDTKGEIAPGTSASFPVKSASWVLAYNWANNAALGSLSALTVLPEVFAQKQITVATSESNATPISVTSPAETLIANVNAMATNAAANAWGLPIPSSFKFEWGSSHELANVAIFAAYAVEISRSQYGGGLTGLNSGAYAIPRNVAFYLLGSNPLDMSMVTGMGKSADNIHHRVFNRKTSIYAPKGWLVGGPNGQIDQAVLSAARFHFYPSVDNGVFNGGTLKSDEDNFGGYNHLMTVLKNCRDTDASKTVRSAMCHINDYHSYHTNEVAINWQASWLWLSSYLNK